MYSNVTPNLHLPQYVPSDPPTTLGDYNNAMEIIDKAIHNNDSTASTTEITAENIQTVVDSIQSALDVIQKDLENLVTDGGIAAGKIKDIQVRMAKITPAADLLEKQSSEAYNTAVNTKTDIDTAKTQVDSIQDSLDNVIIPDVDKMETGGIITALAVCTGTSQTVNVKDLYPNNYNDFESTDFFVVAPTQSRQVGLISTNTPTDPSGNGYGYSYSFATVYNKETGILSINHQTGGFFVSSNSGTYRETTSIDGTVCVRKGGVPMPDAS